jgi:hypothetical protein
LSRHLFFFMEADVSSKCLQEQAVVSAPIQKRSTHTLKPNVFVRSVLPNACSTIPSLRRLKYCTCNLPHAAMTVCIPPISCVSVISQQQYWAKEKGTEFVLTKFSTLAYI